MKRLENKIQEITVKNKRQETNFEAKVLFVSEDIVSNTSLYEKPHGNYCISEVVTSNISPQNCDALTDSWNKLVISHFLFNTPFLWFGTLQDFGVNLD